MIFVSATSLRKTLTDFHLMAWSSFIPHGVQESLPLAFDFPAHKILQIKTKLRAGTALRVCDALLLLSPTVLSAWNIPHLSSHKHTDASQACLRELPEELKHLAFYSFSQIPGTELLLNKCSVKRGVNRTESQPHL